VSVRQAIAALELQHSETAVVHAASRILAALIAAGRLTETNSADLIRSAVQMALALALETDRVLESDDERGGARGRLGPLA
jgi:hypothetical protein